MPDKDIYHGVTKDFDLNEDKRLAAYFIKCFSDMGIADEEKTLKEFGLSREEYEKYVGEAE